MGVYVRGTAIVLVRKFYVVDPLSEVATLANPDTVTFVIDGPNGAASTITYVYGVNAEVTHPSVGLYLCEIGAPLPTGEYTYEAIGTGAVEAIGTGAFTVVETGAGTPAAASSAAASWGPCAPWITGDDVLDACGESGLTDAQAYKLETAAALGSDLMFNLSGRQYAGICEKTVRPCRSGCGCFGQSVAVGLGPYDWGGTLGGQLWWQNECGDQCGCGIVSSVRLAGYVREIVEVKIGGTVVDPATYRLDGNRDLVSLGAPWPACQQMDLAAGAPGTFAIRYRYGIEPPELGRQAAAQIGCELWKALNQRACALPAGATRVVRQGITIEKTASFASLFSTGATGLPLVDLFLTAANPSGARQPPLVYSPDVTPYPREIY